MFRKHFLVILFAFAVSNCMFASSFTSVNDHMITGLFIDASLLVSDDGSAIVFRYGYDNDSVLWEQGNVTYLPYAEYRDMYATFSPIFQKRK